MPFRATFDCLWCGTSWTARSADDLEGWAQLCPDCVGRAGDNEFLRFRLRHALAERSAARGASEIAPIGEPVAVAANRGIDLEAVRPRQAKEARGLGTNGDRGSALHEGDMVAYYQARASEYDDWYLRRGRYSHGPIHDAAWNAELDAAGRWLDELPIGGEIVELAAGTGWWSPLLAGKGQLSLYDAAPAPLDRARDRLLAHGLRAHIHVRDAWAEPDRQVDTVFTGFWLSHVERARLDAFLGLIRRWLKPGGTFAFIDSRRDPKSGASDHQAPGDGIAVRRLDDGREFTVVKVFHEPVELVAALGRSGFVDAQVTTTSRFFLLGRATAAEMSA
jgi:demethylmenaquinone methyltransferase/2-methoxy-6-polyprenyl-1,4-benzoquinol methylase